MSGRLLRFFAFFPSWVPCSHEWVCDHCRGYLQRSLANGRSRDDETRCSQTALQLARPMLPGESRPSNPAQSSSPTRAPATYPGITRAARRLRRPFPRINTTVTHTDSTNTHTRRLHQYTRLLHANATKMLHMSSGVKPSTFSQPDSNLTSRPQQDRPWRERREAAR